MNTARMVNRVWYAANWRYYRRFRAALVAPERVQQRLLNSYVTRNAETAIGRRYGFSRIESIADFQQRVPLTRYEDYEPFIDAIARGQPAQLTAEPVQRLLPTSGSSGSAKFIPYSARLQSEFNRAIGPWIVDLFKRYPTAPAGPAYWSVSPALTVAGHADWAMPIGFEDDTQYLGAILGRMLNHVLAVPSAVRCVAHVAAFKYITTAFLLARRDLRLISVWHPSFLTLLLRDIGEHLDEVIRSLYDGILHLPNAVDRNTADILRARWTRNTARAAELDAMRDAHWHDLWPHLALISAWGDGASNLPWTALRAAWPGPHHQPKGLIATEGIMTIPFEGTYPLAITSHVFEFLDDDGQAHIADDLRAGQEYEIVLTTAGGLYRYRIGDRVRVTGFARATPSLEFIGRNSAISDMCGEKLSEAFVSATLRTVLAPHRQAVTSAVLQRMPHDAPPGYCLHLDMADAAMAPPGSLAAEVDRALQENPHYALCIRLGQLQPVRIVTRSADDRAWHALIHRKPLSIVDAPAQPLVSDDA